MLDNRIKALEHFLNEIGGVPEMGSAKKVTIEMGSEVEPKEEMESAEPSLMEEAMGEESPSVAALEPEASEEDEYSEEALRKMFKGMKGAL